MTEREDGVSVTLLSLSVFPHQNDTIRDNQTTTAFNNTWEDALLGGDDNQTTPTLDSIWDALGGDEHIAISWPDIGETPSFADADVMTTNTAVRSKPDHAGVLKDTFTVYGPLFLATFFVFCVLRRSLPQAYAVRRTQEKQQQESNDKNKNNASARKYHHQTSTKFLPEDLPTHLADNQHGFLNWLWKLFLIPDEEMMEECGLDALCFVRICSMGYRLTLSGMFNAIWLMPIYATAEDGVMQEGANGQLENVSDPLFELTTGHVPSESFRFVATALAAYILFGHAIYVITEEIKTFTSLRHKFLRKPRARNFSVYVRNIPAAWRTNRGLQKFFERSIGGIRVQSSHVCLETKNLRKKVAEREKIVTALEHAVAQADESGKRPTHQEDKGILKQLHNVQHMLVGGAESDRVDSIDYYNIQLKNANRDITESIAKLDAKVRQRRGDQNYEHSDAENNNDDDADASSSDSSSMSMNSQSVVSKSSGSLFDIVKANTGGVVKRAVHENIRLTKEATGTVAKAATGAVKLVLHDADGKIYSAGFIVFSTLSTTQAVLQMVHHEKPYEMEAIEAPDPDDVLWSNVGREHKDLQMGTLLSLAATFVICVFWSFPVSFVTGLSNVQELRKSLPFLDAMLDAMPMLQNILQVFAPQLLIILNALLPIILKWVTTFEGSISGSVVQSSLFVKLAYFSIIQTFFMRYVFRSGYFHESHGHE